MTSRDSITASYGQANEILKAAFTHLSVDDDDEHEQALRQPLIEDIACETNKLTRERISPRGLKGRLKSILGIYTDQTGKLSNIACGLSIALFLGIVVGLWMPKNTDLPTPWYRVLSSIIGYTYVFCWSVSVDYVAVQCNQLVDLILYFLLIFFSDFFLSTVDYQL